MFVKKNKEKKAINFSVWAWKGIKEGNWERLEREKCVKGENDVVLFPLNLCNFCVLI